MSDVYDDFQPTLPPLPPACPQCTRPVTTIEPFCKCGFDLRYGSVKLQKSGTCIYCGREGKLSAEHVFGDWLRRRYDKPAHTRQHHLARPIRLRFFEEKEVAEQVASSKKVQPYSNVVFNVCEECNNTWMSAIHKAAAPIVSKFADGFWPRLSEYEILSLSRWVAMVTINLECLGRIKTSTDLHRSELKAGRMPPGWGISVGRMISATTGGDSFHRAFKLPLGLADDFLEGQITYFCIENVVFSSISTIGDMTYGLLKYHGVPQQFLPRRIWPECDHPTIMNKFRVNKPLLDELMDMRQRPFDTPQSEDSA